MEAVSLNHHGKLAGGGDSERLHIAIIMDGNGRWAKSRGLPRVAGHREGAETVRRTIEAAVEHDIGILTLYGFSSENWKRPPQEVNDLMGLLRIYLRKEVTGLDRNGVRLRIIGDRGALAPDIVEMIADAEQRTSANKRLIVNMALNYGGRSEILNAARALAAKAARGAVDPAGIDEAAFENELYTGQLPDPDLLIRTSGEQRLSNFLLWQCAYTEFVFVDTHWPAFTKDDFAAAIEEFMGRDRRYGGSDG